MTRTRFSTFGYVEGLLKESEFLRMISDGVFFEKRFHDLFDGGVGGHVEIFDGVLRNVEGRSLRIHGRFTRRITTRASL